MKRTLARREKRYGDKEKKDKGEIEIKEKIV